MYENSLSLQNKNIIKHEDDERLECHFTIPKEALDSYKVEIKDETIIIKYEYSKKESNETKAYEESKSQMFSYTPGKKIKESTARIEGENTLVIDVTFEHK
ncbi:hypothetical protein H312_02494 [Anncaliia algerae PRA339]|uniref:SHSP domain-containing protein n=1 Tax=Anncaliia algerae PRA339 TaxID=1288291 RepID=A0A059EYY4_9MICR|nr:hypothetical protein H312_02494 [Anncaliia algerae PRA339]